MCFQLSTVILQFAYIARYIIFQPLSLEVLVKCLALHSGGFWFPPKDKGFFLTGGRHAVVT